METEEGRRWEARLVRRERAEEGAMVAVVAVERLLVRADVQCNDMPGSWADQRRGHSSGFILLLRPVAWEYSRRALCRCSSGLDWSLEQRSWGCGVTIAEVRSTTLFSRAKTRLTFL